MLRTTFRQFSAYIPKGLRHGEHPPDLTKMGNDMVAASYIKEKYNDTINDVQKKRDKVEEMHKVAQNVEETTETTTGHPTGKKIIPADAKVNKLHEVDHKEKGEAELKNTENKMYD